MLGEEWHVSRLDSGVELMEVNADFWKTWVHQRLVCEIDDPSAMTLFRAAPRDHLGFAKHVTAEKGVEEYVAGKGVRKVWSRLRRGNHWFDALYMAAAAAHACGVRVLAGEAVDPPERADGGIIDAGSTRPDGRNWLD
jgi:phage terminase large subunit GpA-like protein